MSLFVVKTRNAQLGIEEDHFLVYREEYSPEMRRMVMTATGWTTNLNEATYFADYERATAHVRAAPPNSCEVAELTMTLMTGPQVYPPRLSEPVS